MSSTKSAAAREMYASGTPIATIAYELNMQKTAVYKAIKRLSPEQTRKRRNAYKIKSTNAHKIVAPWDGKPAPVPTGKCVAWIVVEGKAQQCGAKCKGQRCKDHPITIARTIRIGARTGGGLAA